MISYRQQKLSRSLSLLFVLVAVGWGPGAEADEPDQSDAMRVFEERIMPIFRSPQPSSCVQCHLASVDLKDYILPSHVDTFVALREQGLIDLHEPAKSKILTLIQMGEKDLDAGAKRIHQKVRQAEYEAFSAWIKSCCQDPSLVRLSTSESVKKIGPDQPLEVVRHARKSRVVESFTRKIWSQRMRCFPCHTPFEINPNNPQHKVPSQRHAELVEQYGAKMNLFQQTPEETLDRLIAGSRKRASGRYPLINLDAPAKSLLLLKPTSKLPPKLDDGSFEKPSSSDPVSHMGGLKMHVNDQSYKAFVSWIEDYAAVVKGEYLDAKDLPADNWIPTERILRMAEVPQDWGQGSIVQLFVHSKNPSDAGWSAEPIAFTQGIVTPRWFANGPLFLIGSSLDAVPDRAGRQESDQPFPLPPGEYLIKVYLDSGNRLQESPSRLLGQEDFVGQTAVDAKWQAGFPLAELFSATTLTSP